MEDYQLINSEPRKKRLTATSFGVFSALFFLMVVLGLQIYIIIQTKARYPAAPLSEPMPTRPINLAVAKAQIIAYYSSGMYEDDLSDSVDRWQKHFTNRTVGPKDLVVFDIDDTVLSNYPTMVAHDFGYIPKLFDDWIESMNATAIPQTKQFYLQLLELGYNVAFITGRRDTQRNATVGNLHNEGFTNYVTLILREPSEYSLSAFAYKSARRKQLAEEGWEIVGSIGDQLSDIDGDYAGYRMKVPNPCYYIA